MLGKYLKLIFVPIGILVVGMYFFFHAKTVCNNKYWEIAKSDKKIENIEVCTKEHNVDAAIFLSNMYATGDTVEKNHQKAINVIKEFVESGNSLATIQLASLYSCYAKQYTDFEVAEKLYKKAINNQDNYSDKAKFLLAQFYRRKLLSATHDIQDINSYIDWLNKIANEGNVEAIHLLASEYQEGQYLPQDYYASLEWLKKAAEKDSIKAYRAIGNYYANGFLGDPDYIEANYWFQKAVSKGDDVSAKFLEMNPKPFDLEITKATISDFKKIFNHYEKSNKPNYFNGGYTYFVNSKYIPLKDVEDDVVFIFNKNNILEAVLIVFNKNQYTELQNHLKSKYIPFIEGATNMFRKGITEIVLTDHFEFFSTRNTVGYNSKVCTLVYKSRGFSTLIFKRDDLLRKKEEEVKRKSMNML